MSLRIVMELEGVPETPAEHSIAASLAEIERVSRRYSADWYELIGNLSLVNARMHWRIADQLRADAAEREKRRRPRGERGMASKSGTKGG